MVTLNEVKLAKNDDRKARVIYDKIFYPNGDPVVTNWLVKNGVSLCFLDEVESMMRLEFCVAVQEYSYNKVPFEFYVWTKFKQVLCSWYRARKQKNNDNNITISLDEAENVVNVLVDLGNVVDDISIDFEIILRHLPKTARTIARSIFYSDWKRKDIIEYFNLSNTLYYNNLNKIKEVLKQYWEI